VSPQQEIDAALARLVRDGTRVYVMDQHSDYDHVPADITQPLAALIRANSEYVDCGACAFKLSLHVHADDCALMALVRVVNGGGK